MFFLVRFFFGCTKIHTKKRWEDKAKGGKGPDAAVFGVDWTGLDQADNVKCGRATKKSKSNERMARRIKSLWQGIPHPTNTSQK